MPDPVQEWFGIAANVADGTKHIRPGALCWVCSPSSPPERSVCVNVRSRSGRWIGIFLDVWKLENFRAKWLVPPKGKKYHELRYSMREAAEETARYFDRFAGEERARRNVCNIERMAGLMDEHGRRK